MKKIAFINSVYGYGSTGKICVDLSQEAIQSGYDAKCFYGRNKNNMINGVYFGNAFSHAIHFLSTRLFDLHGLSSKLSTKKLIKQLKEFNPDIIHIHNIHGYYINYELLFDFLKNDFKGKVVWTLHDCWSFTGHCSYFTFNNCNKWKNGCAGCCFKKSYPASFLFTKSKSNYERKRMAFSNVPNLTIVTPSEWLKQIVKESFLGCYPVVVINNGIDVDAFSQKNKSPKTNIILCVNMIWEKRKGINYINSLMDLLPQSYQFVIVGSVSKKDIKKRSNVTYIKRISSKTELANLYSKSLVLINPTLEDNYPTTCIEAISCGTPVITFDSGGAKETVPEGFGYVADQKNVDSIIRCFNKLISNNIQFDSSNYRESHSKEVFFKNYLKLYEEKKISCGDL